MFINKFIWSIFILQIDLDLEGEKKEELFAALKEKGLK